MPPNPRAGKAFRAMKELGISLERVKPVLKKLLKVYDKNWELVEEENYRALVDAIFEQDDTEETKKCNEESVVHNEESVVHNEESIMHNEESVVHDEGRRPLKRLRLRGREVQNPSHNNCNLNNSSLDERYPKKPKVEQDVALTYSPHNQHIGQQLVSPSAIEMQGRTYRSEHCALIKGKERLVSQGAHIEKQYTRRRPSNAVQFKDPGILLSRKQNVSGVLDLIMPKDEPFTDDNALHEHPIAVIRPDSSRKEGTLDQVTSKEKHDSHRTHESVVTENGRKGSTSSSSETVTHSKIAATTSEESPSTMQIATSQRGEIKISLNYDSLLGRPNFRVPDIDQLLQAMEGRCLWSYKILDPNFSVKSLMKDMCETFLDLATKNSEKSPERALDNNHLNMLKKSTVLDALDIGTMMHGNQIPSKGSNCCRATDKGKELEQNRPVEPGSLVIVSPPQITSGVLRLLHDAIDITRGEEELKIAWTNESNNNCPPPFHYISQSVIYKNANVRISISKIRDEDCCPNCFGDCLSSSNPCACAGDTGQDFAYTPEGLIKDDFLEEYISATRAPAQQNLYFCRNCPLEMLKDDDILEPCKGHLKRKYIKECWSRCGCNKNCANRVVQRGISCNLQVFFSPGGKGWGLRTLEKLPKGAFICEFAGEILTNLELHDRQGANTENLTCSVPLDACWYLIENLKDEEVLFLDASRYGNVARFINHRCLDANLINIPVKVEMPDHHYYRLAFFTTREVEALEELTRDYGIDFDDQGLLVKAFRCQCGSKFCRNIKRSTRSRF